MINIIKMKFLTKTYIYLQHHDALTASLVLSISLLIFISPALILKSYYAPTDIIRQIPAFADGSKPHNRLLSDALLQFLPWFKLSKDLIISGNFPLWNIYSGGGLPLFANMQSATLYPLSLLFYFLDFKYALFAYAFFKLFFIGFFTYIYFKELRLQPWIAMAGATGFMYAGYNVVSLLWPNTSTVFLLPCGLYLIEKYFKTGSLKFLLWLSIALCVGVFSGHPETLFHIVFTLGLYILFKIKIAKCSIRIASKHAFRFIFFGLLGAGLSSILFIPFFEYLKFSVTWTARSSVENEFYLPITLFILNFIPDFFGNQAFNGIYFNPFSNYNESSSGFVGITLLFLALYVVLWHFKDSLIKYFAFLALFCLAVIYKAPLIFFIITRLPGFRLNANNRMLLIFAFAIATLGAFGLQRLSEKNWIRDKLLITVIVFLCILLLVILAGISMTSIKVWLSYPKQQMGFLALFLANFIVSLWIIFKLPIRTKPLFIVVLIFLETGIHGSFYNSISKKKDFYPVNNMVIFLRNQFPQGFYKTFSYHDTLPPNLGTWYEFNQINEYDAIGLKSYQDLKKRIGKFNANWETFSNTLNFNMLKFLGAKYLAFPRKTATEMLQAFPEEFHPVFESETVIIFDQPAFPRAYILNVPTELHLDLKLQELMENPDESNIFPVISYHLEKNGLEEIHYNIQKPGFLVLNENYYPGWEANIDNSPAKIQNSMGLRAISLPLGKHEIKISYKPLSFRLGLILSLCSIIFWLILSMRLYFKSQEKEKRKQINTKIIK